MTERQNEIRRLTSLPSYLAELGVLVGRSVSVDELLSAQETEWLRDKFKQTSRDQIVHATISFEERTSNSFTALIDQLHELNKSPVVLWPPKANDCGLLSVRTIKDINFDFPFDLNPEGILVIATSDGLDRMLLDFSDEEDGRRSLEIELHGPHWTQATLPTPNH